MNAFKVCVVQKLLIAAGPAKKKKAIFSPFFPPSKKIIDRERAKKYLCQIFFFVLLPDFFTPI
jgi:hypothetical protein